MSDRARDALAVAGLLVVWAYKGLSIVATLHTRVYQGGDDVDSLGQFWMSWWASEAFYTPGRQLFFCPIINTPDGSSVFDANIAYLHVLASGLLRPQLGPQGAINVVFLAGVLCSLLGVYVLARQLTSSRLMAAGGAVLAELLIIEVNPEFSDLEMANYGVLALALTAWIRLLTRGGGGRVLLAGLLVGLTCVEQMYYGISLLLLLGMAVAVAPLGLHPGLGTPRQLVVRTVTATAVGLALALPLMASSLLSLAHVQVVPDGGGMADLGARYEWLFANGVMVSNRSWSLLGLVPLAGLAAFDRRRQTWFWLAAMALMAFLATSFLWDIRYEHGLAARSPWMGGERLVPFIWRLTFPRRFGRMAVLLLVALLVASDAGLARRLRPGRVARVGLSVGLLVLGLAMGSMLVGRPPGVVPPLRPIEATEQPAVPEFYRRLGRDATASPLLILGCQEHPNLDAYHQVFHGKPIAANPARGTSFGELEGMESPLAAIQRRFCEQDPPPLPYAHELRDQGVRYVVLYESELWVRGDGFLDHVDGLYGRAVAVERGVRVYDLEPVGPGGRSGPGSGVGED